VQHGARLGVLALAVIVTTIHGACRSIEVRARDDRLLRIELFVFRGLGESQGDQVRREVEAIWAAQAVRIEWSCAETTGCVRVVIDRPASTLPAAGREEQWNVAATRIVAGHVSGPIYVSVDAAERVVRAASPPYSTPALRGVMVTRVVGRALAHELAHFLLDTREHSQHGLLRARVRADDFVSPGLDGFNLDDKQLTRARRHELLVTPLQ
jgi:hypothetical protein